MYKDCDGRGEIKAGVRDSATVRRRDASPD